jgi:hypothetical protein
MTLRRARNDGKVEAWGMNQNQTIALFLECEAIRAEAQAAALAEGKSEDDAREIAHEAAKVYWNAWAEPLLAERKAMEADGRWDTSKADWSTRAKADFSYCLFLNKIDFHEAKEATLKAAMEKKATAAGRDVKSIPVEDAATRFGATFQSYAWFDSATVQGDARFSSATFQSYASFGSATFQGGTRFDSATFQDDAWFKSAAFSGDAWFRGQTFTKDVFFNKARFGPGRADFGLATFERVAQFDGAAFTGEADFNAVSGKAHLQHVGREIRRRAELHPSPFRGSAAPRQCRGHANEKFRTSERGRGARPVRALARTETARDPGARHGPRIGVQRAGDPR